MPPYTSFAVENDDLYEIQKDSLHLTTEHHYSLLDNFNAIIHGNIFGSTNGSHSYSGSGNGHGHNSSTSGAEAVAEEVIIILALLGTLFVTVGIIFLIAVAVSRMRRADSLQEVVRRNEFKLTTRPKRVLQTSASVPADPSSHYAPPTISEVRSHPQLKHSHSTVSEGAAPNFNASRQGTPWFLQSTTYYKSQFHLNKLRRQESLQGSLHSSFHSMQSINVVSDPAPSIRSVLTHSQSLRSCSELELNSPSSDLTIEPEKEKKKSMKKLRKVFQAMNFHKKIKQRQEEKNRFNIYTIPSETREQLKQIYVY